MCEQRDEFVAGINKVELKSLIKEALLEIMTEHKTTVSGDNDLLDVPQAAAYIKSKVSTLYEKTSAKMIPHFKKGNRILFKRQELDAWIQKGKVKTTDELRAEAITYSTKKKRMV